MGKKYVFRKELFYANSNFIRSLARGLSVDITERWVNRCDGKEVTMTNERNGYITAETEWGKSITYNIGVEWCEEVTDNATV